VGSTAGAAGAAAATGAAVCRCLGGLLGPELGDLGTLVSVLLELGLGTLVGAAHVGCPSDHDGRHKEPWARRRPTIGVDPFRVVVVGSGRGGLLLELEIEHLERLGSDGIATDEEAPRSHDARFTFTAQRCSKRSTRAEVSGGRSRASWSMSSSVRRPMVPCSIHVKLVKRAPSLLSISTAPTVPSMSLVINTTSPKVMVPESTTRRINPPLADARPPSPRRVGSSSPARPPSSWRHGPPSSSGADRRVAARSTGGAPSRRRPPFRRTT